MTNSTAIPSPLPECLEQQHEVSASRSGHNSFYFHCDVYHGRSSYSVCQHTVRAVQEGREQLRTQCHDAIAKGLCPAVKMMAAEELEGRALYFRDRRIVLAQIDENLKKASELIRYGKPRNGQAPLNTRKVEAPAPTEPPKVSVKPTPKKTNDHIDADLAGRSLLGEAIESMMEER